METFKNLLDVACQVGVLLLMLSAAWWLFRRASLMATGPHIFERWAGMKDDDQLMAIAVLLVAVCVPLAVGLVLFVLLTHPTGYDTLIGGVVQSLFTLGGIGMLYFFNQGHAGKKAAASLAEIAAEPSEPSEQK